MTDPYAETDEWPTVLATRPHGKDHPDSNVPAGSGAREAHWAAEMLRLVGEGKSIYESGMAVADQETADLRAEVERLRGDYSRAAKYRDEYRDDAHDASEALLNMIGRLEAAEAESARLASVVAKVEALADKWEQRKRQAEKWAEKWATTDDGGDRAQCEEEAEEYDYFARGLRAALASVAPEPTPNTGERIDWSNTVLVLRQLAQTIGSTPKGTVPVAAVVDTLDQVADRLLSGEFPPAASSVDDKEGER